MNMYFYFVFFAIGVRSELVEPVRRCDPLEIQCDDGHCIQKFSWCDSTSDCSDRSDEMYCNGEIPCKKTLHFECKNKKCIPISAVCDGFNDCHDGSDEECDNWVENITMSVNLGLQNFNVATPIHIKSPRQVALDKAVNYLLSKRNSDYGWEAFTPRAVIALSMASKKSAIAEKDKHLMLKQTDIQMLLDLIKNRDMNLSKLALYINVLYATCQDPRNYQGMDLIARLRSDTDGAIKANATIPLAFLTLCISNLTRYQDNYILTDLYNSKQFQYTGSRALTILAMACVMHKDRTNFSNYMSDFFTNELPKAQVADVYTQILVMQASIAVGYPYSIDDLISKQLPDGSFGDSLATYYAIPVLLNSSLLNLICHDKSNKGVYFGNQMSGKGENEVVYSLWITSGNDTISRSKTLSFDGKKSAFDIMKIAASNDLQYRFQYEELDIGKMVYSVAGIPNDVESGRLWFPYISEAKTVYVNSLENLLLVHSGLDKVFLKDKDNFVFWLKTTKPTDKL